MRLTGTEVLLFALAVVGALTLIAWTCAGLWWLVHHVSIH